jgi:hypothetical protein
VKVLTFLNQVLIIDVLYIYLRNPSCDSHSLLHHANATPSPPRFCLSPVSPRRSSEVDAYVETMKSQDSFGIQSLAENVEDDPFAAKMLMVGTLTVQVTKQSDSFYILADGALVGPLKKITVGPSALKHKVDETSDFELPVQSFFPVAAFDRDKEMV